MREYLPLLIVCAVIGMFTILFLAAYAVLKRKTKAETSERHMSDGEIIRRLLSYAKPYKKDFFIVFIIMLVSIAYDVVSPLLVADIQGTIKKNFELSQLYSLVAVYAGILVVSMVCTYFQAMILQKTGQNGTAEKAGDSVGEKSGKLSSQSGSESSQHGRFHHVGAPQQKRDGTGEVKETLHRETGF